MTIFQAIILGIVQGLTELLPISSSAHLNLIPAIFGWNITERFDIALHFGTLLAIGIFFFKDWINLIVGGYKKIVNNGVKNILKDEGPREGTMFWYLVVATIPGAIIGFLFDHYLADFLIKPLIIAIALIIMGIILYVVDKKMPSKTEYENMTLKQTFLIGLSQALAFIPGVSRSGITMTTARGMGVSREAAAKYSFMLSAPIVFGACILKITDFEFTLSFFIGILISFLVGIFVIKFLLDYLKKGSFKGFAIYRVIIGLATIIWIVLK